MAKETKIKSEDIVKLCEEIAYDRKAENIIRLDLKELPAVSDYFLLCTAISEPHIRAIADRIQREVLEKVKVKPLHVDGSVESHWIIVDFGGVMVHVMTENSRAQYQLEDLWGDAPKTDAVKRIEDALKSKAAAEKKKNAAKEKTDDAKVKKPAVAKKAAPVKKAAAPKKAVAIKKTAVAKKAAPVKKAAAPKKAVAVKKTAVAKKKTGAKK